MHLKLPDDPIPLVLGKAFHSALEQMARDGKDPVKIFEKEFTKDKVNHVSVEKFAMEREEASRLLKYWRDNHKEILKNEGFKITEHEVPFKLQVDQDPLTKQVLNLPPIHGFVDFVHSKGGIGDYKTSSKKYHQEDVDTSDQPTFYYLWHLLERGTLPTEFVYIVFRKGIKKEPIQILRTQRTMKQVSDLLASIQRVVLKIEDKQYYIRHDENERFCDCDLYEKMLSI